MADEKTEETKATSEAKAPSKEDLSKPSKTVADPELDLPLPKIPEKKRKHSSGYYGADMKSRGCGTTCIKYTLFAVNFCLLLLGIAILVIGSLILAYKDLAAVKDAFAELSNIQSASVLIIIVGAVVVLIGFLGCCGASMENLCMLGSYFGIMIVIVILEITAMALAFTMTNSNKLQIAIESNLGNIIKPPDNSNPNPMRVNFVDFIQASFNCCGAIGPKDYEDRGNLVHRSPPPSCYTRVFQDTYKLNTQGCGEALSKSFKKHGLTVGLVSLAVVLTQLVALGSAIALFVTIRREGQASSLA